MLTQNPSALNWKAVDREDLELFGTESEQPSSQAQREIFSASLTDSDASRAYNHSISIFFEGALDVDALYSALLNLLARHEALRGCFSADGERFRVRERIAFALPLLDIDEEHYPRFVRQELDFTFDLVNGPLFRAWLLRFSPTRWVLIFNCHHVVVDGWSLKIILDDLPKLYSALVSGREEAELDAADSFSEYLETAVEREAGEAPVVRQFWKQTFADGVPVLDLPTDNARPALRTYASRREDYKIDRKIYEQLKTEGARGGSSQFVTLFSAFALYLHRVSGQDDFVIAVPAAGQIRSGKAKLLGHDARLLPIRCLIKSDDTFRTFSKRVMEHFFAAYEHQWISLPELIRELNVALDPSRVPLVPVMFNFDPGMKAEDFQFHGLKAHHFFNHRNFETVELSINAVVENGEMVLETAYNAGLFEADEMHRRLEQLETLMASAAANPDLPVSRLKILPDAQLREMDAALNSTAMAYDASLCVDQLIERAVAASPERVAVEYREARLSYAELWEKSEKIRNAVLNLNLGARPLVGVLIERSEAMVPVLLGIWRAGGAFVPLDPSYPRDRLEYMVEQSGIRLILSQASLAGSLQGNDLRYVDAAEVLAAPMAPLRAAPAARSSNELAYVIYTSGSTGKPKGVKVPQHALHNFIHTMRTQKPGIGADDRVLAVTTLSFDIAELELWLPLVAGARTVIVDRATAIDGAELIRTVKEKQINFMQATPATWRLLVFSGWEGDKRITALCGGEALPRDLADEILKRVGTLWNVYGPTETTVWSTLDRVGQGPVTIGRPIGNTQCYVLDAHDAWVPRGVVGELWIGGDGVTDGYFGRDDLTAERFKDNPFTRRGRMYKTGDLVRLRRDGRIEYVGRNDSQVKVRGFRIELGEVQHAAARHPAIQQCVVAVKEKSPGDAYLVAYYVLKAGAAVRGEELKASMRGSVPDYMLPSHFVALGELPLTQNGKINVKALPAPFAAGTTPEAEFVAPRTECEIYLARLWGEALSLSRVGRDARFVDQGGHSLLAIKLIQRIFAERGRRLSPKTLILKPLSEIAAELEREPASAAAPAPEASARPAPAPGRYPVSSLQSRVLYLEEVTPGTPVHNIPMAYRLSGALDTRALENALNLVIARHEALRTRFALENGTPVQHVEPVLKLSLVAETVAPEALDAILRAESARPFDLFRGPLLGARLYATAPREHVLLLVAHHAIFDGTSFDIVLGELGSAYESLVRGTPLSLKPVALQYGELKGPATLERDLEFWTRRLGGELPVLDLPLDKPRPRAMDYKGDAVTRELGAELSRRITDLARQLGATPFMTLLAAFKAQLARLSGQSDLLVGTPIQGRTQPGADQAVGFFANTLVVRTDLGGEPRFRELVARVRESCLDAYEHQEMPFERLAQQLKPRRDLSRSPIFQAFFGYQNTLAQRSTLHDLTVREVDLHRGASTYDLTLWVKEGHHGFSAMLDFPTALFERATIERWLGQYLEILEKVTRDAETPLGALPGAARGANTGPASAERAIEQALEPRAPRSGSELFLAGLWQELLGVSRVSLDDNFFALGGHSLLSMQMIARVETRTGKRLSARLVLEATLEQLARELPLGQAAPAAPAAVAQEAFFFGNPDKQKFGCYHAARADAPFGVLLCPPLGQEYMRTHSLIRGLALALQRHGLPVLRFDYFGHGDSAGASEETRLADLTQSLLDAANELKTRSGNERIKLVAFRASALLASLVGDRLGSQCVYVDAPTSGADYVADLRELTRAYFEASESGLTAPKSASSKRFEELMGTLYARELVEELETLRLRGEPGSTSHLHIFDAGWNDVRKFDVIIEPQGLEGALIQALERGRL